MVVVSADKKTDIDILRFTTVGSVDDGKSTLIGRMLYDSKGVFEDQLAAVAKTSSKKGFNGIDFSLLTDGLAAEREQGITIDVAYRYFSTPKRKFIIADTPGHEQYTRNMVTGASTAHLTIILLDARKGILDQSRRHALISSLLGIPNFIVAVNKMDLVDYSEEVFEKIVLDFKDLVSKLNFNPEQVKFIPISALNGHNVVYKYPCDQDGNSDEQMTWYQGPTILDVLETVDVQRSITHKPFRLPVQYVIRVDNGQYKDFRAFAGQVASGIVAVGDELVSLPSGARSRVKTISSFDGDQDLASAGQSIALQLEDEIDISRGDMLVKPGQEPELKKEFKANICWMSEQSFELNKKYLLKHTSNKVKAIGIAIDFRLDINSYEKHSTSSLKLNDIAQVSFKVLKPLALDHYSENHITGSFILIDEMSNNTVAAGMVI
jgi:sulfate adenylyltransferase subunit 1